MPVFRVEKNSNYTTMCNYHLRDQGLSLKGKGLLSMLLSLPDTWNYSVRGLSSITPDGVDGVLTALKELERLGYLERNQQRESNGRMGRAEYVIYEMPRKKPCSESPCTEKPYTVNPDTDTPVTENPAQLSTNRTSTETINKREKKEIQHRYGGDVVNFKTTKHFRDKRNHYIDRSQWRITENVHEPIIDRTDFETAQRILENAPVKRPNGDGEIHPLSGLLFCKDCGAKMHIRIDYRNGGKRHVAYCSEYHKGKAKNPKCHSPHIMDADLLMQTIAEVLKKIEDYSISNRAEFEALVKKNLAMQQTDKTKKQQKRIPQITTRLEQIDKVLNKLYEDNALGTISQDRYEQMSQKYSEEYYALKAELATLQEQLSAYENAGGRAQKFLKLTERHAAFTDLTPTILNEFISRIEVHERDQKRARYAIQHISIYFNYIGNTWINPYMLVMGRNNETVKFLDARNEYVPSRIKGKRINLLNDEGITEIVKKYESGESCIEVSVSEMEECDYVLTPNRYVKVNDVDANLVRLGNMVKEVKRGITLSASDMDQMIMDNPSDIRCLLPSDITAGVVTAEKYFHGELRKPGKNEANRGDVLISKTGNPFRIAVADRSYLVVGNTYILNIDSSKYSPEYIKCYLSSEAGQKEIMKYASGATTPIISVANLSSIEIPVHDEATQKEMDKHAENILSAMEESYKQIKICEDEMNALFR